jgi:hypothetical protein
VKSERAVLSVLSCPTDFVRKAGLSWFEIFVCPNPPNHIVVMNGSALRRALTHGEPALGVQMVLPGAHIARVIAGIPGLTVWGQCAT